MDSFKEILDQYCQKSDLGPDFETRVFSKIGRQKTRRRIGTGLAGLMVLVATLLLLNGLWLGPRKNIPGGPAEPTLVKQEVPLNERFYFASSDAATHYSIEQVSYIKNNQEL